MSFLRNYLTYCEGNEAPQLYHTFSAFSVLASLVSRRVWIKQGIFTFYPNLYVVLVGGPGGGKSTALDIAKGFVRSMRTIPLAADATTVQALLRSMTEEVEGKPNPCKKSYKYEDTIVPYSPITIFAGELVSFIGMDPYGWVVFLTTVYSEEVHEVKTKNKGDDLLEGPFINLLGCLTNDTTTNLLQQKVISSGFSRRTIYVYASGRDAKAIPFPEITEEQRACLHKCKDYGLELQKIPAGPMTWEPEAREWYGPWYVQLRADQRSGKLGSNMTSSYFESKHVQLLKLAMLVSLSESTDKILRKAHFDVALAFLEQTEQDLEKVFIGAGRNQESSIAGKILEILERIRKPMAVKEIFRSMYNDAKREEIEAIIHHLCATDRCRRFERTINGQPAGEWLATLAVYQEHVKTTGAKVSVQSASAQPPSLGL